MWCELIINDGFINSAVGEYLVRCPLSLQRLLSIIAFFAPIIFNMVDLFKKARNEYPIRDEIHRHVANDEQ